LPYAHPLLHQEAQYLYRTIWNYFIKAIGTMRSKEDFVHEKTNHMNYTTVNNHRLISIAILLIRVWMGVVLFYAGAGKLYGWFGGFGMETTIKYFAQTGINTFFPTSVVILNSLAVSCWFLVYSQGR
jgi:hypothetical protein